jgi:hypothetical protein
MWSTRLASVALPVLLALALAGGASVPRGAPRVRTVVPTAITLGQRVTLTGRGFVPGRGRDTVVLMRPGSRSVFIRADRASATRVVATITACRVLPFLRWRAGRPHATRFLVSVLGRRLSATPAAHALTVRPAPTDNAPGVRPGTSQCLFDLLPNPELDLLGGTREMLSAAR